MHVALWVDGELTAGAVALPAAGVTFGTDEPPAGPDRRRWTASGSRSAAPGRPPSSSSSPRPSTPSWCRWARPGSRPCPCSRDEADAYVHAGGQFEWDSAAPVAVARAAGLHTSRIDGSPLRYNQPDPTLPDLVVCRPELAERILAAIATVRS